LEDYKLLELFNNLNTVSKGDNVMDRSFGKVIFGFMIAFASLFATATLVHCQETKDNFKFAFVYKAGQFKFDAEEVGEYVNGYQVDVAGRIVGKKTRLYGVINVERNNDITQLDPETYPIQLPAMSMSMSSMSMFDVVRRDTTALRFGARLSHNFGNTFEPFATALVGFRASNDVQPRKLERSYQVGSDVNVGHFFFRVGYQFNRVTGNEEIEQGYLFGAGFKF
jgi:hypothetical protein